MANYPLTPRPGKGGLSMDAVIVLLILLFVLLAIGVPVGFAIGGATMISMFFFSDLNMVVNAQYCYSGIFSFTVMAIPYFMLAGTIMSTGGIARRIVDFASALIDFVTGALGCVSMLACMFFSPYRLRHGHHLCHRRHDDPRNEAQGL